MNSKGYSYVAVIICLRCPRRMLSFFWIGVVWTANAVRVGGNVLKRNPFMYGWGSCWGKSVATSHKNPKLERGY